MVCPFWSSPNVTLYAIMTALDRSSPLAGHDNDRSKSFSLIRFTSAGHFCAFVFYHYDLTGRLWPNRKWHHTVENALLELFCHAEKKVSNCLLYQEAVTFGWFCRAVHWNPFIYASAAFTSNIVFQINNTCKEDHAKSDFEKSFQCRPLEVLRIDLDNFQTFLVSFIFNIVFKVGVCTYNIFILCLTLF